MKRIIIVICIVFLLTLLKPLIIEGEEETLTLVPEEKIKEIALVHAYTFYHPFDNSLIKYDLSKVLLIPIYDYQGNLYMYNAYVYLGESETPTLEEILSEIEEPARYWYSHVREYKKPQDIIEEYREILKNTSDNWFHQILFIPYFERKPLFAGGGEGCYFDLNLYWLAVIGIEDKFPENDIEFIGLITKDGAKYGYEFEINGKRYIVEPEPFTFEVKITPIEEIKDSLYTIEDLENSLDENAKEWAKESWDGINESITKLKLGIDFIDENLNKESQELEINEKINMLKKSREKREIPPPQPDEYYIELTGCYSWDEDIPDFKQSDFAFGHLCAMTAAASILAFNTFQSQWAYYPGWLFEDATDDESGWDWDYNNFDEYDWNNNLYQRHQDFGDQFQRYMYNYDSVISGAEDAYEMIDDFVDDHNLYSYDFVWNEANWWQNARDTTWLDSPAWISIYDHPFSWGYDHAFLTIGYTEYGGGYYPYRSYYAFFGYAGGLGGSQYEEITIPDWEEYNENEVYEWNN